MDSRQGEQIPLGARILKAVLDFDALEGSGNSKGAALQQLNQRGGWYDPQVLTALEAVMGIEAKYEVRTLKVWDLKEKMILAEDIKNPRGILLIAKGQEVNRPLIERLKSYTSASIIKKPIRVIVAREN